MLATLYMRKISEEVDKPKHWQQIKNDISSLVQKDFIFVFVVSDSVYSLLHLIFSSYQIYQIKHFSIYIYVYINKWIT